VEKNKTDIYGKVCDSGWFTGSREGGFRKKLDPEVTTNTLSSTPKERIKGVEQWNGNPSELGLQEKSRQGKRLGGETYRATYFTLSSCKKDYEEKKQKERLK